MSRIFSAITDSWALFTGAEKRNIAIYIAGIMLYKFGLEAFNGSIVALATNRYDWEAELSGTEPRTFERVGLLVGLNQAFQCVGSILIAPLIKRFPTKVVLAVGVFTFTLFTAILMIVDAASGGTLKPKGAKSDDFSYYGSYATDGMIPIYCFTGIAYGMVELIRRVIPRDIVGGNVQKLRRMDALVHIFYEVAGTAGAFCTALGLIPRLGNNFSFLITPIFFTCAAGAWMCISKLGRSLSAEEERSRLARHEKPNYLKSITASILLFFQSVWTGAKIIFTSRRYIWLLPGYAVALYGHRYLENGVSPVIARRYLGNSAWSQIMVGGSNLGELLGALFVFLFTNLIQTPQPWLRLDALMLLIPWFLGYWYPPRGDVNQAWIVAAAFIPVSFGWAAGDVSLAAYIQATLARKEAETKNVSALGAVMAFLYSTYIVMYAIASPLLGRYVDRIYSRDRDVHVAVRNIAGVHFTVICVIIFAATFVPKGAFALNPKTLYGESLDSDIDAGYKNEPSNLSDGDGDLKNEKEILAQSVKPGRAPL